MTEPTMGRSRSSWKTSARGTAVRPDGAFDAANGRYDFMALLAGKSWAWTIRAAQA